MNNQTFSREEGARIVELTAIKMAHSIRNRVSDGHVTLDTIMKDASVKYWLDQMESILKRIN